MGGGAGRTLKQVAHVTQDKVSHIISEVGRRNREFFSILFVKTTDFQLVFYNFEHGIMAHIRQLWMHAYLMMLAWPISGTMKMGC